MDMGEYYSLTKNTNLIPLAIVHTGRCLHPCLYLVGRNLRFSSPVVRNNMVYFAKLAFPLPFFGSY